MTRSTIPAFIVAAIMLLAGGWVLGLVVDPAWVVGLQRPGAAVEDDHPAHDNEHEGHVHLSESAFKNLNLRIRRVKLTDGQHTLQVPGEIVEKPGHSDHALASPVNGVVTEVYALPGQAVRPGDPLFKLQVIDEALATAQLNLLNTIARLVTVDAELKRVSPLADSGTVLGRKKLELQYERDELRLKQELYAQELTVRGLQEEQVATIKSEQKLIREFIVRMPADTHQETLPTEQGPSDQPLAEQPVSAVSDTTSAHDWEYTIEELKVFPGKSVERGEDLCHVAYHSMLYIRGQVFENELPYVLALGEGEKKDWTVTAIFGTPPDAKILDGLRVHYVDNHVDSETQTYMFYVRLENKVVRDTVDDDGRRFRTWQFKPGQRVHLNLPTKSYQQKVRLPPEAVVTDGANAYVFREVAVKDDQPHDHSHAAGANHAAHGDEGVLIDMERVPVEMEFRNSQYILLSPEGELRVGDSIAMDNAYQLYLEQKSQSGGGNANAHGHEH